MGKFNAGKASVLALVVVLAVAAFLLEKSLTNVLACVVDVCPNIDGIQEIVPEGYHLNDDGQCIINEEGTPTPEPTPTPEESPSPSPEATPDPDICKNIDGIQTSVPDGMHIDASGQNCVNFGQAGPPPQGPYTPPQGQVLGSSTMAGTGSFDKIFYQAIMSIGATLSAFGLKGLNKAKKTSRK